MPGPRLPETFIEDHELAGPRAKQAARAGAWVSDALQHLDTSVSALALAH
jgi:transposase